MGACFCRRPRWITSLADCLAYLPPCAKPVIDKIGDCDILAVLPHIYWPCNKEAAFLYLADWYQSSEAAQAPNPIALCTCGHVVLGAFLGSR